MSSMLNSWTSLPSRRTDFPKATWIFPLTWGGSMQGRPGLGYKGTQFTASLVHDHLALYSASNGVLALHRRIQHVEVGQALGGSRRSSEESRADALKLRVIHGTISVSIHMPNIVVQRLRTQLGLAEIQSLPGMCGCMCLPCRCMRFSELGSCCST